MDDHTLSEFLNLATVAETEAMLAEKKITWAELIERGSRPRYRDRAPS